ncbi:MAG TPA: hemerythrin domain-containing protein [Bacillales bacterium]|nr:hemerythrin domain-containing protein [Bacillales bacterium]
MSGPALRRRSSHRAIHEASYGEAEELTALLRKMAEAEVKPPRLLETAYILVEHWETKILAHAEAEEEGLYVTAVEENPKLREKVEELTNEHECLRTLVRKIKDILLKSGVTEDVLSLFDALLLINETHNYKEETQLLRHR